MLLLLLLLLQPLLLLLLRGLLLLPLQLLTLLPLPFLLTSSDPTTFPTVLWERRRAASSAAEDPEGESIGGWTTITCSRLRPKNSSADRASKTSAAGAATATYRLSVDDVGCQIRATAPGGAANAGVLAEVVAVSEPLRVATAGAYLSDKAGWAVECREVGWDASKAAARWKSKVETKGTGELRFAKPHLIVMFPSVTAGIDMFPHVAAGELRFGIARRRFRITKKALTHTEMAVRIYLLRAPLWCLCIGSLNGLCCWLISWVLWTAFRGWRRWWRRSS